MTRRGERHGVKMSGETYYIRQLLQASQLRLHIRRRHSPQQPFHQSRHHALPVRQIVVKSVTHHSFASFALRRNRNETFLPQSFRGRFHGGKEDIMSLDFRKEGFLLSGILVQQIRCLIDSRLSSPSQILHAHQMNSFSNPHPSESGE